MPGCTSRTRPRILPKCCRVLKPGGRIAAGDWMKAPGPYSRDMAYFFEMEGLDLPSGGRWQNMASCCTAPASPISASTDITDRYRAEAHEELARMKGELAAMMLAEMGEAGNAHFVEDWRSLTVVLDKGELRPAQIWATQAGLIYAATAAMCPRSDIRDQWARTSVRFVPGSARDDDRRISCSIWGRSVATRMRTSFIVPPTLNDCRR